MLVLNPWLFVGIFGALALLLDNNDDVDSKDEETKNAIKELGQKLDNVEKTVKEYPKPRRRRKRPNPNPPNEAENNDPPKAENKPSDESGKENDEQAN